MSEAHDTSYEGSGGEVNIAATEAGKEDMGPTGAPRLDPMLKPLEGLGPWVLQRFQLEVDAGRAPDEAFDAVKAFYIALETPHLLRLGRAATTQLIKLKQDPLAEPLRTWVEVFTTGREAAPQDDEDEANTVPVFEPTPDGPFEKLSRAAEILKASPGGKPLNDTEARVLELMVLGERDKEIIGRRMGGTPPTTVKGAMSTLYGKYGLKDEDAFSKADKAVRIAIIHLIEGLKEAEGENPETEGETTPAGHKEETEGEPPLPPFAVDILAEQTEIPLNERECQILILDLDRLDQEQIASEIVSTWQSVRSAQTQLNRKLGVPTALKPVEKVELRRRLTRELIFRHAKQ